MIFKKILQRNKTESGHSYYRWIVTNNIRKEYDNRHRKCNLWNLSIMIQNKLFRDCLSAIPAEQKAEFELSFGIAERISEILKAKGLTQKDFARLLNKRDSEISKWLTGRHNFTTQTIARIETALGSKLISIAHWLGYAYEYCDL